MKPIPDQNFNIMYTNLDSVSNKKDELENYIKLNNIDVALLCETLPKNSSDPNAKQLHLSIQGYEYIEDNFDRGVCIVYKKSINITEINNIKQIYNPS